MKRMQYIRLSFSILLFHYANSMVATELNDSVDTYQNQTVSTEVFVQGRDVLTSNNVTVTPTGDLILTAPERIVITGPFEVQLGGQLKLDSGHQCPVVYDYDSSGNTIFRQKN
ncbi:MAG: hypothetical protein J6X07_09580 [Prevotella sp.]|nr:hypothetical protein [Prevotella sp.]